MNKKTVNIDLPLPIAEDDLFDLIDGSGWELWGWGWSQVVDVDGVNYLEIHMDDPEDTPTGWDECRTIIKSFTSEQIAEAISKMPADEEFSARVWRDIINGDLDASTADIVCQWLIFGNLVYA